MKFAASCSKKSGFCFSIAIAFFLVGVSACATLPNERYEKNRMEGEIICKDLEYETDCNLFHEQFSRDNEISLTQKEIDQYFGVSEIDYDAGFPYDKLIIYDCNTAIDHSAPPAEAEHEYYIRRLRDKDTSYVQEKLNPRCVLEVFSEKEIMQWSQTDDPVANYVQAYLILSQEKCAGFDRAEQHLIKALRFQYRIDNEEERHTRVPEAGDVLSAIAGHCTPFKFALKYWLFEREAEHRGYQGFRGLVL
jgi:hypothetical protein